MVSRYFITFGILNTPGYMRLISTLDRLHAGAIQNRWLRYFALFNRLALAAGFLPSGMVKIMGERFTSLAFNQPMGHYLHALYDTGYYYTFVGVAQVLAAILLLIPRTALLGALIYFPIILNICILSFALRFEGSLLSSPLMLLANTYLLCWNYDKLKFIFPGRLKAQPDTLPEAQALSNRFPLKFFLGAGLTVVLVLAVVVGMNLYSMMPRNTLKDCTAQCAGKPKPAACLDFCDCIHVQGRPLGNCLNEYKSAPSGAERLK